MNCKHDKVQRHFLFKQTLFILCTEDAVQKKAVKIIVYALLFCVCQCMKYISQYPQSRTAVIETAGNYLICKIMS
jgi:hypothetical protein